MPSHIFGFPFSPYDGQQRLAQSIFDACQNGKTAILESPTGSGKSMAVICSVMSYLEELKEADRMNEKEVRRLKKEYEEVSKMDIPVSEIFKQQYELNNRIDDLVESTDIQRKTDIFLKEAKKADIDFPKDSKFKYPPESREDSEALKELSSGVRKVIYVSRTHSQLAQFAQEFGKTSFSPRPSHLGSRAAFCLNDEIKSLPGPMINCECQRLTKNGDDIEDMEEDSEPTKKRSKREGCHFYNKSRITRMRDQIWNGKLISNQMNELGTSTQACPYFAAKASLPLSDVILMPYSILFDKETRESYGIDLKDNIIIVDEAHNFLETICATSSFFLSFDEMKMLLDSLTYYKSVTSSRNQTKLWGVLQCVEILNRLVDFVEKKGVSLLEQQLSPGFLRKELNLTSDFLRIARSIESDGLLMESRGIVQRFWKHKYNKKESKVLALINRKKETVAEDTPKLEMDGLSLISRFIKLLKALAHTDEDVIVFEKIRIEEKAKNSSVNHLRLRYFKLSIGSDLKKVINESRAFVMVGGTMRPIGYLARTLKSCCGINEVIEKQFPHVIDDSNVLPVIIDKAPSNRTLSLKVGQLNDQVIDDYVNTVAVIMENVPSGCIVFLPNYKLVETFKNKLTGKIKKKLFAESKQQNPSNLLSEYEKESKFFPGALLIASAGGKLSEGINFADGMCRCVAVCGLPYPNMGDIEVKLRAKHAVKEGLCSSENDYLLNQTLRVVSQCVGRAIRHKNDYSAMFFLDSRYNGQPKEILPDWIRKNLKRCELSEVKEQMRDFYVENKIKSGKNS
ncbi:unnamed protein product [Bursaphelenchus xylophilus]|uniref:(pine wood nematode) hypothetical protein n=1 Tax=Bursaphelenchus xylophilus TaxID=6326 RepID=A0A1I7S051_BURXY|nr:unnamed protein product [Bursaphelenchus xylophilus]CAG9109014.1 unnamed protein product [Bursaphelenchus xylophilus]